MFYFCKYKDFFGKPKQGFHRVRYLNIALFDIFATFILAKFIQFYFLKEQQFILILFFTFILGILLHRLFCVRTTVDKLLFG
jgi:hypothetical protein